MSVAAIFNSYSHCVAVIFLFFFQVGEAIGDNTSSVLDFLSMKPYSDVSLDISMLSSLGKHVLRVVQC